MGMKQKDIDREYRKFAQEWLPKVVERGTVFLENLRNRKKIKEEDWDVIKAYHRLYYLGYCEEFIVPWSPPQKESKQTTIFDAMAEEKKEGLTESPESGFGKEFDIQLIEPTIIIENDTDKKETLDK